MLKLLLLIPIILLITGCTSADLGTPQEKAIQACINNYGVPILQGRDTMVDCKFR